MKKLYKIFIDFLVKYYSGTISWKWGKWYMSSVKPTLFIYFLFWGILKVIQASTMGFTYIAWWDVIIIILLIPQVLAGFSMFAVKEQKRLNDENITKNDL
jgi:hypothetical protein